MDTAERRRLRYAIGRAWLGMSHKMAIRWCDDLQSFWDREADQPAGQETNVKFSSGKKAR